MEFLIKILFLIFLYNLHSINSKEIETWKKYKIVEKMDIKNINSYAFDVETGVELFLYYDDEKNKSFLYLSDGERVIENTFGIKDIQQPLIHLDSSYFFCSSSFKNLLKINETNIYKINNTKEMDSFENDKDISIKCFISSNKEGQKVIMVAFIMTEYLYFYDHLKDLYYYKYSFIDSKIILAIDNCLFTSQDSEYHYNVLTKDKNTNKYYAQIIKKANDGINENVQFKNFDNDIIYKNAEIVSKKLDNPGYVSYIFSYEPFTNSFTFNVIGLEGEKKSFVGKLYLRFFNHFKIKYAKFIENKPLLYYSIESLEYGESYIGVVDVQFFLVIFNIEEDINDRLYFNLYNNKSNFLFYFRGNEKISYCPFIREEENEENCIYYENYFGIKKLENEEYYNIKEECNDANEMKMNPYCVEDCPNGYSDRDKNKICKICDFFDGKYYAYGSKTCIDDCKIVHKDEKNFLCYNCEDGENKIFFNDDCLNNCSKVYGINEDNTCKICKDRKQLYSFKKDNCIDKSECLAGELNEYFSFCRECETKDKVYFPYKNKCLDECEFLYVKSEDNICKLCSGEKKYYQKGNCVEVCDNDKGYGYYFNIIEENNTNVTYCEECYKTKIGNNYLFLKDKQCSESCDSGYIITKGEMRICDNCSAPNYYIEKLEICNDECLPNTREDNDNICAFCTKDQYYYLDGEKGKCMNQCDNNQKIAFKHYTNDTIQYDYKECINCKKGEILVNNDCIQCSGINYLSKDNICYNCFCGNKEINCYNSSSQCDCFNSSFYYGYSCEFYSITDINNKDMKIISLTNRLIKTSQNFFTYNFTKNITLPKNYYYSWTLYLNGSEIINNEEYKECFITSNNESIFGIDKKLFNNITNTTNLTLSLDIVTEEKTLYSDSITLIIIDSFEYENSIVKGDGTDIAKVEMETNLLLKNKKKDENNIYKGKYLFQYCLLDENNERFPLTDYIESEISNINVICSKGYYINLKNDREEIQSSSNIMENTDCLKINVDNISDIINGYLTKIEKIFLLISYFRNNDKNPIEEKLFLDLINFINGAIKDIINEDGYYIEKIDTIDNTITNKNITYTEPKLIFSLICYLSNYIKKDLNESSIEYIFELFNNIFDKLFENQTISYNSLSESDIRSLFRTVDNLYDICIDNNLNSIEVYNNIIKILDNLTKYLRYITYPSETIILMGGRISLLTHHLGKHENNISFPYIYNSSNTNIKDILTYYYSNHYLNEQKNCQQSEPVLFCLNKDNFKSLNVKFNTSEENNDIILNVYRLPEINSTNEKKEYNDKFNKEEFKRMPINRNYSVIFKLYQNESNNFNKINDKDIYLSVEFDFPFAMNLDKEEEENDECKSVYIDNKPVVGCPDNSDILCVPKSYYTNLENIKNDNNLKKIYACFTHFNYEEKTIRCSCNIRLNDEIIIVKDSSLAQEIQDIQFEKDSLGLFSIYNKIIIFSFILLLLIPGTYFLIYDIIKESKYIKNNIIINEIEDERKTKYNEIKKYYNAGVFCFSFYLTLIKYPYFSVFNKYYNSFPKMIKHIIIVIGLFIGIIVPLIPYLFIEFTERKTFISQRDIKFNDTDIKEVPSQKYYYDSLYFSPLGLIFGNLFIYIFSKLLNFEQEEADTWFKIKTLCRDYIYYEVKSEVLLGAIWKKIKNRMLAYYYICGKYALRKNKNNKLKDYLKHVSRNYIYSTTTSLNEIDQILPREKNDSVFSKDINNQSLINNNNKNNKQYEMKVQNEPLIENDDDENDILLKNYNKNYIGRDTLNNINNSQNLNLTICKLDNFILDNTIKYDKSKRKIERFEKVRNKYIYVRKRREDYEIEFDQSFDEKDKNILCISPQNSYFYFPVKSFNSVKKKNSSLRIEADIMIHKFIKYSIILLLIAIILIIGTLLLVQKILDKFDIFIIKAWIFPIIITITVINFILYFFKMLFGSFLLFHFYHLRKRKCFCRFLFWIFVDRTMIQIYKVKNLITKYKKEFDYL